MKVQYINHMGDDLSVVNAARVSFGKHKDLMDKSDTKLIRYLAKHNHKSPFNHAFATFHVKAPIFVARQLQKHEYMPWNEISRRYVDSKPELYQPTEWRERSEDKKQGSSSTPIKHLHGEGWSYDSFVNESVLCLYQHLIHIGVCPEQARMVLPQSMYTEWYWSGSLYAFAKMCSLRLEKDAQLETQVIARQISLEMEPLFPVSWRALI
jgi:thymidylate synthase (FAD)